MTFVSLVFLVFMLILYPLYLVLPHRWQNHLLLVGSLIFYGWWDWRFLGLLGFTSTLDWWVGRLLERTSDPARRRFLLTASISANLATLGFFKYFNFFAGSLASLLAPFGIHLGWTTLHIILPIGISFYTFQSMSYTFDVYRRHMPTCRSYLDFMTFVSFFPQLVAGPIERAVDLIPRVQAPRSITRDALTRGLFLILLGLFKKIAVSDGVAPSVDAVYNATHALSGADVRIATWLFAVQIYCDFSGYSDIARGLAKVMGFDLMTNFDQPYVSVNPSEFWRRWHISLSTWLRDYLYIPIGGNRGTERQTYRNLMVTMGLGGLWHGAAWNYVLWGIYQGAILCVHRWFTRGRRALREFATPGWLRVLQIAIFFQVVCYGWLLFRARSFGQIVAFTRDALLEWRLPAHVPTPSLPALAGLALLVALEAWQAAAAGGRATFYRSWPAPVRGAVYAALLAVFFMGLSNAPTQFIYFQF
ncbi:MAG: MBOAT family protein [Candidatus Eisenbacteria bacterium]|nr:MBOAT family protein [Candidatus Eisenbacteria bacterium]